MAFASRHRSQHALEPRATRGVHRACRPRTVRSQRDVARAAVIFGTHLDDVPYLLHSAAEPGHAALIEAKRFGEILLTRLRCAALALEEHREGERVRQLEGLTTWRLGVAEEAEAPYEGLDARPKRRAHVVLLCHDIEV